MPQLMWIIAPLLIAVGYIIGYLDAGRTARRVMKEIADINRDQRR